MPPVIHNRRLLLLLFVVSAFAASLAFAGVARAYSCPAGLISTGTLDEQANWYSCEFYLGASFPLGGLDSPQSNGTILPGLNVLPVWQTARGAGVTVAVLDTGVDPFSLDMAPNLLPGFNTFDGNTNTTDANAHGTLIASIIGAAANNGGYVGIAHESKLLPVKIMGGIGGGEWSGKAAVAGVLYAVAHHAQVINASWGGLNGSIPGMPAALVAAAKADVLFVHAAGNDGVDLDKHDKYRYFPETTGFPNAISVANQNELGHLNADSNYGASVVQIASYGDTIHGDFPDTLFGGFIGGTSAATATVSGVAALLFSAYPQATAYQVRQAILDGGTKLPQLVGKVACGCLLNAAGALAALPGELTLKTPSLPALPRTLFPLYANEKPLKNAPRVGMTIYPVGEYGPGLVSYQWQRCDRHALHCRPIIGAEANGYIVKPADIGHRIVAVISQDSGTDLRSAVSLVVLRHGG